MKEKNNKAIWIVGAILLILVLMIFMPGLIESQQRLETSKREYNLIQEGKTISASDVVEDFTLLLSNKKYNEANKYLSSDCKLIDSQNKERVNLEYCLEKLNNYSSHEIERRGNSIQNEETYRILWNGTRYENTNQIITLFLRRKVKTNEVTYEIFRLTFTDNTLY